MRRGFGHAGLQGRAQAAGARCAPDLVRLDIDRASRSGNCRNGFRRVDAEGREVHAGLAALIACTCLNRAEIEHLACDANAWRADSPRLPALKRVDRDADFLGHPSVRQPAITQSRGV